MAVGEADPGGGEFVEIRRRDHLRAIATEVAVADVVAVDNDDVGFFNRSEGAEESECENSEDELEAIHHCL